MNNAPANVREEFDRWLDDYADQYGVELARQFRAESSNTPSLQSRLGKSLSKCGGEGGKPGPCPDASGAAASPSAPAPKLSRQQASSKLAALGSASLDSLKSVGHQAAHLEHVAKQFAADKIGAAVEKLPPNLQKTVLGVWRVARLGSKTAFATYTAGQALAERVAQARGATPEQARQLRGLLSAVDVASAKPIALSLSATGAGALVFPASMVLVGSMTYLAYSTAKDPLATLKAARGMVKDAASRVLSRKEADGLEDAIGDMLDGLKRWKEPVSDMYLAYVLAALDQTHDLRKAVLVATKALEIKEIKAIIEATDFLIESKFHGDDEPPQDPGEPAPPDAIKIELPDLRQGRNWDCGAVATMAVAEYFGVGPESEEAFIAALHSNPDDGTKVHDILSFAVRHGLSVQAQDGMTLDELKAFVDEGKPVIVLIQAWSDDDGPVGDAEERAEDVNGHYVVAIGYDDGHVYFEDPSLKGVRGRMTDDDFLARWHDEGAGEDGTGDRNYVRFGIAFWRPDEMTDLKGSAT